MRFKLDENLPAEAAAFLASIGHDAATVISQKLGGRPDADIAQVCRTEQRALITLDLDFADIRSYPPAAHPGIIILRLAHQDLPHVMAALRRITPLLQAEPLLAHLWIVDEQQVRIRGE